MKVVAIAAVAVLITWMKEIVRSANRNKNERDYRRIEIKVMNPQVKKELYLLTIRKVVIRQMISSKSQKSTQIRVSNALRLQSQPKRM